MKKLIVSLAICLLFVGVRSSFPEPLPMHSFELGVEISSIVYEEPGYMREKGSMYGIDGLYAYHNIFMLRTEGKFSFGKVDYSSPLSGNLDNIPDYMIEFRGLGGRDFFISEMTTITLYTGLGYRYLNDDSGGMISSLGDYGYERESNYIYSPIGAEALIKLKNGWSVEGAFEYDNFWYGKQVSHLSDADPGYNDTENIQYDGFGLRGSVAFKKKGVSKDYIFKPFIKYWNIEMSEISVLTYYGVIIGYLVEPKNNSMEIGLEFAVRF